MPWAKCLLLFTVVVTMLSSSLRADTEALSETGVSYGAVSEKTVRFGKLLIGGQSTVSDNGMKTSGLKSAESREVRFHLANKLHRLSPSVQCSNDSMMLRIPGPRMPHLMVDRGEESPVPLSEMPASCGFSLKRVRRDLSLVAPYQGCHVSQQGGSYVLPLIMLGAPVQMSCPVSSRLPTVSCFSSGMTVTLDVRADDVKVKVDGLWQPLLLTSTQCSFTLETAGGSLVLTAPFAGSCWQVTGTERQLPLMYGDREVTLSCRLTETIAPTTPAPRDQTYPQQMFNPFPFGRPWWYPYGVPAYQPPTVPPTTPPPPPPQYPFQQYPFPPMYPMPIFDPSFYSKGVPAAPPTAPPAQQPQYPWYLKFPPMYGFQSPADVPTTTPAPYQPAQQYPGYPIIYGYPPKTFVPPAVNYPLMPSYPKNPIFVPPNTKSASYPAQLSSYWSRR